MRVVIIRTIILALTIVFSYAGTGFAQTITVVNDLNFGPVFPGIPKTISKKQAGAAAEYHISGSPGSEVAIEFTLPTYMNKSGFNMQMVFTDADCAIDTSATPDQSNPLVDNVDPWHIITYRLGSSGLTIWLGGMVIPKLVQPEGDYSGTIVLTVSYTGN